MNVENIVNLVFETAIRRGLVEAEVSARHVHLSAADTERLFGSGKTLTFKRELSQPGQFLAEERVEIIGPKGQKSNVAVLGPSRADTQIELSRSDCVALGVDAPLRLSGDVQGSAGMVLKGTAGSVTLREGAIIAQNHIHMPSEVAAMLGLCDRQRVDVELITERPLTLKDVVIRISDSFRYRMHIDFDEANAAMVSGFTLGRICIPSAKEGCRTEEKPVKVTEVGEASEKPHSCT